MPEDLHSARGEETSWLSQYYTSSKTGDELDAASQEDGPAPSDLLAANAGEKYDVTGQVGVGGMKTVHRAHDRNADRDVALAMLRKDAPRSAKEQRFLREARITAALEHPNIVPVHEIGLDAAQRPYFTMKLLGGENLHDILHHLDAHDSVYLKQYPLGRLLEIFQNVCQAVAFAHSRGVAHLDLKPANIQVGSFGEVLVLDWGLAKILEGAAVQLPELLREVPVEGAVRGTPGYMAPEQERGDFAALDARTDIYALGAVLRALLNGNRRPAPALAAVATKAMAANPRDRYPSVSELARDVRAFLGGYAVSAQSVGLGTLFWLLVKRNKAVSVVVVASLVTITALLTMFIVKIKQSEQRALVALQKTLESERRAVDALDRLREEQAEKIRIGRLATFQLLGHAQELIRNVTYDEALSELNLIVMLDNNMAQAWTLKGFVHLGRLEFEEAMQAFDRVPAYARRPKRDLSLRAGEIAEKYRQLMPPAETLSYPQLRQLIEDITSKTNALAVVLQQTTLGQLFQHVNQAGTLDTAHLEFVRDALGTFNPQVTNLVFQSQTDTNGLALEIHGSQLNQLLPLTGLPMYALDLSRTAVVDPHWLRHSGLQVLNLASTPITDLSTIFNLPLTELNVVDCVNFRLDQLRNFPRLEKVSVSQRQLTTTKRMFTQTRSPPEVVGE